MVCTKRLVFPRVDDCVSLVMTTTEEVNPCTKQLGHMYVFGGESGGFSIGGIYESLMKEYEPEMAESIFDMLFERSWSQGSGMSSFLLWSQISASHRAIFLIYREMRIYCE